MARPRIFISSTYYDLRSLRDDLARDIEALGYEAVIHERSDVPYADDAAKEVDCEREIGLCDMLVSVIGGRFGSASAEEPYSISQMELKTAQKLGKMVYIFVDEPVYSEYRTYQANRELKGIVYRSIDDERVFKFLDELAELRINNATIPFRTAFDITRHLRAQWSGLFHRLLNERAQASQLRQVQEISSTAQTLSRLVTTLSEQRELRNENVRYILLMDHPLFTDLATKMRVTYRVFFTTLAELDNWLLHGRSFTRKDKDGSQYFRWEHKSGKILIISRALFGAAGELKIIRPESYSKSQDEFVRIFDDELDEAFQS